jgi:hypothetical protein
LPAASSTPSQSASIGIVYPNLRIDAATLSISAAV